MRDRAEGRIRGDARQGGHVPAGRPERCRGDDPRQCERKDGGDGFGWYNAAGDGDIMNRATDLVLAGTALVAASPLLALAALAVKLEDGGPVLYKQTRVGKDGADFELLKLRTMVVGAEHQGAGLAVDKGDARITRAGAVLRRLSLDELPQLWNVVRGDMSMIGPRPTLRYQVEQYTPHQRRRLEVKPGITGWAQIHGRARLPWEERIELDVWYVEHRSPLVDVRILLRTPLALFGGTYKGATGGWRA
jgi:lipopolysaccharide/colanic/teichoic acid biosynthesis glycosyltransferase